MNAVTPIIADEEGLYMSMAAEALEAAKGVSQDAIEQLAAKALADSAFIADNLPTIVRTWASKYVQSVLTNQRSKASGSRRAPPPAVDGAAMRDVMAVETGRLMDMPLWGGKPIGAATAEEIYASADKYDLQARTMTKRAEWQAAVAAALEKNGDRGDKVRDCLTEATLQKLWEEANGN